MRIGWQGVRELAGAKGADRSSMRAAANRP